MEEKKVCSYCGTIFEGELEKCPLCGSRSYTVSAAPGPEGEKAPRQRSGYTGQSQRSGYTGQSHSGGRYASPRKKKNNNRGSRTVLVVAVILLLAAVLLALWFIGDMIGWWPGLEDLVDRETEEPSISENETEGLCTALEVTPERELTFKAAGETIALKVTTNAQCTEEITIQPGRTGIVRIVPKGAPVAGVETRTQTFDITAEAPGGTTLSVICGEQKQSWSVTCTFEPGTTEKDPSASQTEQQDPSGTAPTEEKPETGDGDPKFKPVLNYEDISFFGPGENVTLKVTNLPGGAKVTWESEDEEIITVSEDGKVTAVGPGTAHVTATVMGKSAKMIVRCKFEDTASSSGAKLNYEDVTISVGEIVYLRLYDKDDVRITEGLTYACKDSSICSMDDNGVVGVSPGTTKVIVTWNGEEFTCIVRVRS